MLNTGGLELIEIHARLRTIRDSSITEFRKIIFDHIGRLGQDAKMVKGTVRRGCFIFALDIVLMRSSIRTDADAV